jgi:hypothetical protein
MPRAGKIIVDANDIGASIEEALAQVRAKKPGTAGDQGTRFKMQGIISHRSDAYEVDRYISFRKTKRILLG